MTQKSTRIITKYLKNIGIDVVLRECGNNLRAFNAHIRRECNLDKKVKLYNIDLQAKEVLKNRLKQYGKVLNAVEIFLKENFGGKNE